MYGCVVMCRLSTVSVRYLKTELKDRGYDENGHNQSSNLMFTSSDLKRDLTKALANRPKLELRFQLTVLDHTTDLQPLLLKIRKKNTLASQLAYSDLLQLRSSV